MNNNKNVNSMKQNLFLAALAFVALASCTSDEFVGENTSPNSGNNNGSGAISFNSGSKAITRATGAEAAKLLNNNFVVEGIKTISSTPSEVFDNYNVNYLENTADKTASNTANWEYVNQTKNANSAAAEQTIKYWDFAASQYDFWAYSLGGGSATVSTLAHDATLTSAAYTISGDATNLAKVYISDLVTAYNPVKSESGVGAGITEPAVMGNEVTLSFRSLVSKVRVGLYETIPGYSVREVKFYPASNDTPADNVVLYAAGENLPSFNSTSNTAEYKVSFPTIGASNIGNGDYNKAHVTLSSTDKASKVEFGTLSYGAHQDGKKEKTGYTAGTPGTWTNIWVQRSSNTPTWAKESAATAGDYSIVLPNESGEVLTLKVDYTLESIDGTGETIEVHGATALLPSQYTQWKPNYAYTYLFKISDNTNGFTNVTNSDKVGLYPITLDAVAVGFEEGTQETITTVATPSITTYSITSKVTVNNEYTNSDAIYATATTDGTLLSMTDKATLYRVTKNSADYAATEAEVLAALTTYSDNTGGTYTGRNEIVLAPVTDGVDLTKTEIPLVDGNKITVTAGQVALLKSGLSAGTYAFVYDTTTGTPAETAKYEAVTIATGESVSGYWVYNESTSTYTEATGNAVEGTTYYVKYNTIAKTYAIKVIKIVAGS